MFHDSYAQDLHDGETLVDCLKCLDSEVNHFFYPEHLTTSPAQMKVQKHALYDNVFGKYRSHIENKFTASHAVSGLLVWVASLTLTTLTKV